MAADLDKKLMSFWTRILKCNHCQELPDDYYPQFRPVGKKYKVGGVAICQINPGHIGQLTEEVINARYKSENNRKRAMLKQSTANHLTELQKHFTDNPTSETWKALCVDYGEAMSNVWGWPPGKYRKTIERHGASLESVAIVNLMQCPVPRDRYSNKLLSACWSERTLGLLEILQPKIIVGQGKTVLRFLRKQQMAWHVTLLEGVHQASRASKEKNQQLFDKTRKILESSYQS